MATWPSGSESIAWKRLRPWSCALTSGQQADRSRNSRATQPDSHERKSVQEGGCFVIC